MVLFLHSDVIYTAKEHPTIPQNALHLFTHKYLQIVCIYIYLYIYSVYTAA